MSLIRTLPFAALSATLLAAGGASAQSMYSIDQRQDYQQDRIERGIRDGQITRSEAYRLEQGERAIDRAQARARGDGVVTPQERARIDRMVDREGREIYRQSHDNQQAWDRGQSWGRTDGRYDGWHDRYAGRDGWGRGGWDHDGWGRDGGRHDGYADNRSWDHDGWNRGNHSGWGQGNHNGWDGNRPSGIERRDARNEQRIYNGVHDGSINRREFGQLQRGQERIDRYEARARSDGNVSPYERNRIDQMQNRESRQIYADRHNASNAPGTPPTNGMQPGTGSHNWGGFQRSPQAGNPPPTSGTQPGTGSHNWGGFQRSPQAGNPPPTNGM